MGVGGESEPLLEALKNSVINGMSDESVKYVNDLVSKGVAAQTILDAMAKGVLHVGEQLSNKEAFLPELVITFDAFRKGLAIIEPALKAAPSQGKKLKVVLGTVEGDIHNIGKNLVKTMFEASSFEVYDVGVDVPPETFAKKAVEVDADLVGCSTLVSPGLISLRKTVERVRELRGDKTKIIIGGYATSPQLASELGIIYCKDAYDGVNKIRSVFKE